MKTMDHSLMVCNSASDKSELFTFVFKSYVQFGISLSVMKTRNSSDHSKRVTRRSAITIP